MWSFKNLSNISIKDRDLPINPIPLPIIKPPEFFINADKEQEIYLSNNQLDAIEIIQSHIRRALTIISIKKLERIVNDEPLYYDNGIPIPTLNYELMFKLQRICNANKRKCISWADTECSVCSNPEYIEDPSSKYRNGVNKLLNGVGGICKHCGERVCPLHHDTNMQCIVCEINQ